jgi:hypothetical protein
VRFPALTVNVLFADGWQRRRHSTQFYLPSHVRWRLAASGVVVMRGAAWGLRPRAGTTALRRLPHCPPWPPAPTRACGWSRLPGARSQRRSASHRSPDRLTMGLDTILRIDLTGRCRTGCSTTGGACIPRSPTRAWRTFFSTPRPWCDNLRLAATWRPPAGAAGAVERLRSAPAERPRPARRRTHRRGPDCRLAGRHALRVVRPETHARFHARLR